MEKISFIIPCMNESGNIEKMYNRISEVFLDIDLEIIFVDDGSTDSTFSEISILSKNDKRVKGISFSRNFGKEASMLAGLQHAKGTYTSIIDADMQQDPFLVIKMMEILDNNPDVDCVCARQIKRKEPYVMVIMKKLFYSIINSMCDINFEHDASDFRTFRSNIRETLISMQEYSRFSKGLFSWIGFKTVYVDYEAGKREVGKTKWSFRKLIRYALSGISDFSVYPLILPFYIGIILFVISLIYVLIMLFTKETVFIANNYQAFIFSVIFIGGIIMTTLGVLGSYIAKMFIQEKKRPIYIIKKKVGNIDK